MPGLARVRRGGGRRRGVASPERRRSLSGTAHSPRESTRRVAAPSGPSRARAPRARRRNPWARAHAQTLWTASRSSEPPAATPTPWTLREGPQGGGASDPVPPTPGLDPHPSAFGTNVSQRVHRTITSAVATARVPFKPPNRSSHHGRRRATTVLTDTLVPKVHPTRRPAVQPGFSVRDVDTLDFKSTHPSSRRRNVVYEG